MKKFVVMMMTGHTLRFRCDYIEVENETLLAYCLQGDDFELIAAFDKWDYVVGIDEKQEEEST